MACKHFESTFICPFVEAELVGNMAIQAWDNGHPVPSQVDKILDAEFDKNLDDFEYPPF